MPLGLGEVGGGAAVGDAGAVDEHVDGAEPVLRLLRHALHARPLGDVHRHRQRAPSVLRDRIGHQLGLARVGIRHRDRGARLGQAAGHGRAQPARAAHHHRGLPVQPEEIEARHARRAGWIISSVMSSGSKK
jgi:hypothetical protein